MATPAARTGRYKMLAIVGTAVTTVGMFLLSQMTASTDNGTLVRNMVVLGLGLGTSMALFTIVVQNAFPIERLGVVTASLAFFRSIGGVVGVALLGSIMTNRMTSEMASGIATLPAPVAAKLGPIAANPQALMDPAAQAALKQQLAALGPSAQQVAAQISSVLRGAVASAITEVFLIGAALIAVAFVASFFLREIPLRQTRHSVAGEIAVEFGAPVGDQLAPEVADDGRG